MISFLNNVFNLHLFVLLDYVTVEIIRSFSMLPTAILGIRDIDAAPDYERRQIAETFRCQVFFLRFYNQIVDADSSPVG